jgi:hypothetical protein
VRIIYIEVYGIFDSFRLVLKIKSSILKERGSFIVKGLTKMFDRAIYR